MRSKPSARPRLNLLQLLLICVGSVAILLGSMPNNQSIKLSYWLMTASLQSPLVAAAGTHGNAFAPVAWAAPAAVPADAQLAYKAGPPGSVALEAYNHGSMLQDAGGGGKVHNTFRRNVGAGEIIYMVVQLGERVHLEVLNADNARPGSDATGDTIWMDGGRHLATVQEIVTAPYAAREGFELLGAMAFGFHGYVRTSNEGTVVIDGTVYRVNPGRAALCIKPDGTPLIGLFDHAAAAECRQAIGAGPVILLDGKIANPDVSAPTEEFVPFNPLGEDFVQIDWRRNVYSGTYPKTAIGIGSRADGGYYLVMAVSYGVSGVDLARQLRDMGCTTALGGDDDTSTQLIWRGAATRDHPLRAVPDAVAIYGRN